MNVIRDNIAVVIPTYNERDNVLPMVKGISRVLPEAKVVFVDDNSPDGTARVIEELQSGNTNIILIKREAKLGLGTAYPEAFKKIIKERLADVVVIMDGDMSHPVERIPMMLDLLGHCDLVVGSRYINGGSVVNWPVRRKFASRVANFYNRLLTGLPVKDMTSGFMAVRTKFLSSVNLGEVHSRGYAFLVELKFKISDCGGKILEYPITFTERRHGKSKLSFAIIKEAIILPINIFLGRY